MLLLAVAALGIFLPGPGRYLSDAHGIPVTLAVLVATTGLSISTGQIRDARGAAGRLFGMLAISSVALPLLAWVASRLVDPGPLRLGVLTAGVAPTEVAAVALTALGGGVTALTAALMVGSTVITVVAAGPVLGAFGADAAISSTALLAQLVIVVALPLVAGVATRATLHPGSGTLSTAAASGTLALLVLLWQVASQITLQPSYLAVTLALLAFLAGSAALGWLLTIGQSPPRRIALALPIMMRDFAIAAGIAATAYGPAAAAPLGIYGVLVLLAGTVATRIAPRDRSAVPVIATSGP